MCAPSLTLKPGLPVTAGRGRSTPSAIQEGEVKHEGDAGPAWLWRLKVPCFLPGPSELQGAKSLLLPTSWKRRMARQHRCLQARVTLGPVSVFCLLCRVTPAFSCLTSGEGGLQPSLKGGRRVMFSYLLFFLQTPQADLRRSLTSHLLHLLALVPVKSAVTAGKDCLNLTPSHFVIGI